MDDFRYASKLSNNLALYDYSKQSVGQIYGQRLNEFWPEMAKSKWHINFYIKNDDLSNASTLSDSLALYDSAKHGVGQLHGQR